LMVSAGYTVRHTSPFPRQYSATQLPGHIRKDKRGRTVWCVPFDHPAALITDLALAKEFDSKACKAIWDFHGKASSKVSLSVLTPHQASTPPRVISRASALPASRTQASSAVRRTRSCSPNGTSASRSSSTRTPARCRPWPSRLSRRACTSAKT
jgi:hypothetical protein